jgi:CDP-diacylglycerol--inositol 3-phosphatidyltransferase
MFHSSSLSHGLDSHKSVDKTQNFLLRIYYNNKLVLFLLCAFNEIYWVLLYLAAYSKHQTIVTVFGGYEIEFYNLLSLLCLPFCAMKHLMNFIQLIQATKNLVALDVIDRMKRKPKKR